uniref:Uncharacterized protein n=1 Tax=Manihot esculenta TaxID=3983 RepID=A0A2C9UXI4_MANES
MSPVNRSITFDAMRIVMLIKTHIWYLKCLSSVLCVNSSATPIFTE